MKKSRGAVQDDVFGNGVYFTAQSPIESKQKIAENNWDGHKDWYATQQVQEGKMDYYIAILFS